MCRLGVKSSQKAIILLNLFHRKHTECGDLHTQTTQWPRQRHLSSHTGCGRLDEPEHGHSKLPAQCQSYQILHLRKVASFMQYQILLLLGRLFPVGVDSNRIHHRALFDDTISTEDEDCVRGREATEFGPGDIISDLYCVAKPCSLSWIQSCSKRWIREM